jgi:hypothetical protein
MDVTFTRTGERRYAIACAPAGQPAMHLPAAPGFDRWLPHDLAHFLVERHFALSNGIFGQVAAGSDAGTFMRLPRTTREARKVQARSKHLRAQGESDVGRSERLAGVATACWYASRGMRWEHADAVDQGELGDQREPLVRVIDGAAERWHALAVGESITLEWPDRLRASTRRPGKHAASGSRRHRVP